MFTPTHDGEAPVPRLFTAIRPPSQVREVLLAATGGIAGARWQDDDQLHLTLDFYGQVEPRDADALVDALSLVEAEAFVIEVQGVGHFERKGAPSALWAALAPSEPLTRLQERVAAAARRAGLEPERRRFRPHITLARLSRAAGPPGEWLAAHGTLAAGPWQVEEFVLYESLLRPEGPIYEPLMRFPLRL